jgi:hypothetical protein
MELVNQSEGKSINFDEWKTIKTIKTIKEMTEHLKQTLESREKNWGPPQSFIEKLNKWLKSLAKKHEDENMRILYNKSDNIRFDGY